MAKPKLIKARIPQNLLDYAKSAAYDSKMESEYAHQLQIMKMAKIINNYRRCEKPDDTMFLTSADRKLKIKYTPDFKVFTALGDVIMIEVKGRNFNGREDRAGVVNFKHFAIQNPQFRFIMVTKEKGAWKTMHDLNPSACPMDSDPFTKAKREKRCSTK